ncbi:hypothetical protein [Arthrobacter sp. A5]|uniref:hypothetical protein n=1 Tax=Arthrobacter sp. A5 TaxID=576926 RepID=UPI003DA91F99
MVDVSWSLDQVRDYGEAKVTCERLSSDAVGPRLHICRPCLIAGPGDVSDWFGYWPALARALAPRPFDLTREDTLADERARHLDRDRRAGLSADEERRLVLAWKATQYTTA